MDQIQQNMIQYTYKDLLVHRNIFQMSFSLGTPLFGLGYPLKFLNNANLKHQGDHNITLTQYLLVYFGRE